MRQDCTNWIGGEWVPTADMTENRCPANTDEVLGLSPNSGEAEAVAAIEAAKAALPAWKETTAPQRGALLYNLVRLLERDTDRLAEALSREEGKIFREAKGEVGKTIRYVEFAAGDARRIDVLESGEEAAALN